MASSIATLAFVLSLGGVSHADAPKDGDKWMAWWEFGGFYNSEDASRGEVVFFAPLMQSSHSLFFADVRGKLYEEDAQEVNFALGFRQMTTSGFNLGAWIGGDLRNTEIDNTFWQLSGGFEALSQNFDARLNWYGPITAPEAGGEGFTEVFLRGNNIFMIGGEEVGLYGVDGELGARIPLEIANIDPSLFELRVYGGGFYFDHEDALEEIAGGKARAELRFNDVIPGLAGSQLTAEYEFSYDDVREERHEVGGRLRIPFSAAPTRLANLTPQERRMMDGLERDTDIVTTQSNQEGVSDALTNVDFDRVAFVQSGGSITGTSAAAGGNSLIIVKGGQITGPQVLSKNQTLQGGASTIAVRGQRSGTVVGFTAPGSRPEIFATSAADVINLSVGSNSHVAGFDIRGTSGQGPFLNDNFGVSIQFGASNVVLEDLDIQTFGDAGIEVGSNVSSALIRNLSIRDSADEGIVFNEDGLGGTRDVVVTGVTISNVDEEGIWLGDDNQNVTIANTTITNTGEEGIQGGDNNQNVIISGVSITNAAGNGIEFDDDNSVTIANVDIENTGDEAILFFNRNSATISNVTIRNSDEEGILFFDNNRATISNVSLDNIDEDGILFFDDNRVTISNVSLDNIAAEGIIFFDRNVVAISNVSINDTDEEGILFFDDNRVTISNVTISNTVQEAIRFSDDNRVTISNVSISNTGIDAIAMESGNTVSIDDVTFGGVIADDVLDVRAASNDVNGAGNVIAPGTVVGDNICEGDGNFTGTIVIAGVAYTDAANNCAP